MFSKASEVDNFNDSYPSYGKSRLRCACWAICLFPLILHAGEPNVDESAFVAKQILVCFEPEVSDEGIESIEREFELKELKDFDHLGVRLYKVTSDEAVKDVVDALQEASGVRFAEPNFKRKIQGATDPRFGDQWSLNNTGQTVNGIVGTAGVDINWPEAMDLYTSDEQVIVAVIDTGLGIDHPEFITVEPTLRVSVFQNFEEGAETDGIDDDQNGYIDDAFGWDFFDDDSVPLDEHGHGSLVSSIIAGLGENGEGGTGIAPNALILPIRAFDDFGHNNCVGFFVESSTYAASLGVKILNASYGGLNYSLTEQLQVFWLEEQEILLVAAAGNGGIDQLGDDNDQTPHYPASYLGDNVISVAAIDQNGAVTPFSNYGVNSVDLAAPGLNIFGSDVSRSVFFEEDFESGSVGWFSDSEAGNLSLVFWRLYEDLFGNTWLTDSVFQVDYEPFTNTYAASPIIDLSTELGPQLTFQTHHELNLLFDYLVVEVTIDDVTWTPVELIYGNGGSFFPLLPRTVAVDLSSFEGLLVSVRFRLWTDGLFQSDGVYIDNVTVTGVDFLEYDGSQYQFRNGTSFAAPMVSGVAALIWSQRPELTVKQVRQIILDSATPLASLDGKVASGGTLDARRAMELAIAAPNLNSDLSISELSVDPVFIDPGSSFDSISYRVGNDGPGVMTTENRGVKVRIYISGDSVFGNGDDQQIGFSNWPSEEVAAGGSRTLAPFNSLPSILIPEEASGEYFVFAQVSHLSDMFDNNGVNDETVSTTKITVGRTFSGWQNDHFAPEESDRNPLEDWDNDGKPNIVEFAFFEDPKNPAASGNLPTATLDSGKLRVSFTRPSGAVGTSYVFQRSVDLATWEPMQTGVDYQVLSVDPVANSGERVTVLYMGALSDLMLLRVVVSLD